MSRMERFERIRGATRMGMGAVPHRIFFNFGREKIFATTHLTFQPLRSPFRNEDLDLIIKKAVHLEGLIGRKLTKIALNADRLGVEVDQKREIRHFNFYAGRNKQGQRVALIEFVP